MDFTREPIIETIITPRDGCKLVIRSSKNAGQEEYFVDAVEIVSFGHALFFRSLERPKAFLAPTTDFEVIEVKEARMVLKNVGFDRSIKIGGGRDSTHKVNHEHDKNDNDVEADAIAKNTSEPAPTTEKSADGVAEIRLDKKRDRKRNYRKRKGKEEKEETTKELTSEDSESTDKEQKPENTSQDSISIDKEEGAPTYSALLLPPPRLISETIEQYRQNDLFKNAFYLNEDEQYKPHEQVDELLNEDDVTTQDFSSQAEKKEQHQEVALSNDVSETEHKDQIEEESSFSAETAENMFTEEDKTSATEHEQEEKNGEEHTQQFVEQNEHVSNTPLEEENVQDSLQPDYSDEDAPFQDDASEQTSKVHENKSNEEPHDEHEHVSNEQTDNLEYIQSQLLKAHLQESSSIEETLDHQGVHMESVHSSIDPENREGHKEDQEYAIDSTEAALPLYAEEEGLHASNDIQEKAHDSKEIENGSEDNKKKTEEIDLEH